jgi:hypothetical protein
MPILLPVLLFAAAANPYDLVIRNGRIVDGTGSPWYAGDFAIRGGTIAAVGNLGDVPARRAVDARGMVIIVGAVQNPKLMPLQGKTIAEIARIWNKDPIHTVFDLLIEDEAFTLVAMFIMSEPDVALGLQQPWVSICNDSQGAVLRQLSTTVKWWLVAVATVGYYIPSLATRRSRLSCHEQRHLRLSEMEAAGRRPAGSGEAGYGIAVSRIAGGGGEDRRRIPVGLRRGAEAVTAGHDVPL